MNIIPHPFYPDGRQYKNWNYSKPFIIPDLEMFVERPAPPVCEIADYIPDLYEMEKIRKAQEKRDRKQNRI
jgi:hypothetical protein